MTAQYIELHLKVLVTFWRSTDCKCSNMFTGGGLFCIYIIIIIITTTPSTATTIIT